MAGEAQFEQEHYHLVDGRVVHQVHNQRTDLVLLVVEPVGRFPNRCFEFIGQVKGGSLFCQTDGQFIGRLDVLP